MNMNRTQTGQSTPLKSQDRIDQCSEIISAMRNVLASASAKTAKAATNRRGYNHTRTRPIDRRASELQATVVYQALAQSMPLQSQLVGGV